MNNPTLLKNLRVIPDFPIPGIQFQDVTTLFQDAECLRIMRDEIVDIYKDKGITKIVGIESRGFMHAANRANCQARPSSSLTRRNTARTR